MVGIGRKKKNDRKKKAQAKKGKEVTPDAAASSPSKDLFGGLITEVKFMDKKSKFLRLNTSIMCLLESICDNPEEMREYALFPLNSIGQKEAVAPVAAAGSVSTPLRDAPQVAISSPAIKIPYNPLAFRSGRTIAAARQQKKRKVDSISACLGQIGTAQQQMLCLHAFLSKCTTHPNCNPVVVGAIKAFNGMSISSTISVNLKEIAALAQSRKNTLDRRTFMKTVLLAIAPSEMPCDKTVSKLYRLLGHNRRSVFRRAFKEAMSTRKELFQSPRNPFVQSVIYKKKCLYTPEFISRLHDWTLHKCDLVVASPSQKESVLVKDLFTGEKKRMQKHYYVSSIREPHNEMIKTEEEGGFPEARNSKGDVVISDTTLRMLLPKQLRRLIDSQKQMCGCEICIISREFVKTLNAWTNRTSIEVERQGKLDEAKDMREFVKMYQHPRDIVKAMSCQEIDGLCRLSCCLCRCTNCPQLQMPTQLEDKSPAAKVISFQCYEYHSYCTLHKTLEGAPTTCGLCKEVEEGHPAGKLLRKQHLTKKKKLIGEFISDYFLPMMIKHRFHTLHWALLGKNHCVSLRRVLARETALSISTQRDYADALIAEFANEIQSTHFGENASISMEGVTVRFGQDSFHYHCYVSDDKRQDARTTFVNQQHLVDHARERGLLPTKTGVMFELMDGCAKQCRCALALCLMSILSCEKNITVDRMISCPHHGKGDCDSQGEQTKTICGGTSE